MRCFVSARSTNAGTTARPLVSLYAPAGIKLALREVGIFNTTTTSAALILARLTTTGTQGAALTEGAYDDDYTVLGTGFNSHSADCTVADIIRSFTLPAAIGAGFVFTFGDSGILIPKGTGNGIGIVVASGGTGQVVDAHFDWDE